MTKAKTFRKRPVLVKAYQHDGQRPIFIDTLEGRMRADPGDWIVTGIRGEQYPVKPQVFAETYEAVPGTTPHRQPS